MARILKWLRSIGTTANGNVPGSPPGWRALARLLADYPPDRPRHVGDAAQLIDAQQDDNPARFLSVRNERLGIVEAFLRVQGVDVSAMLDPGCDGVAAARPVDAWLDTVLPRRPMTLVGDPEPNPDWAAFRQSDRAGSDVFYSLLADLALLEGEAVCLRDPRFRWAVNRRRAFRDMPSFGRICLEKPRARGWEATVLDILEHLLAICHVKGRPGHNAHRGGHGHFYGEILDGAVRRGFDPPPA